MVVGDQRTAPAALPPRRTRYLGGPQGRYGQVQKISPPLVYDPQTVQHVASGYTDYSTPARIYVIHIKV